MKRKIHLQFFADEATREMPEAADSVSETQIANEVLEPTEAEALTEEVPEVLSEELMQRICGHIARLEEETRGLKESFPDFDLYRELQNPTFARLTAPESGVHAEDAYYAIHRKEIQAMQAREPKHADAVPKPTAVRPSENGLSAKAPSVMSFDYRSASKQHREALKKAIRAAAARGEKIYPK